MLSTAIQPCDFEESSFWHQRRSIGLTRLARASWGPSGQHLHEQSSVLNAWVPAGNQRHRAGKAQSVEQVRSPRLYLRGSLPSNPWTHLTDAQTNSQFATQTVDLLASQDSLSSSDNTEPKYSSWSSSLSPELTSKLLFSKAPLKIQLRCTLCIQEWSWTVAMQECFLYRSFEMGEAARRWSRKWEAW